MKALSRHDHLHFCTKLFKYVTNGQLNGNKQTVSPGEGSGRCSRYEVEAGLRELVILLYYYYDFDSMNRRATSAIINCSITPAFF